LYKRTIAAALLAATLGACGGGSSDAPQSTAQTWKLSLYGNPIVTSQSAVQATSQRAIAADASASSGAAAQTVQSLQDALAADGVTATVTPEVMDGTTLHQLIMGEDNGLPPTPDQFTTDASSWLIANFTLDDMVTPSTDPAQQAALAQFQQDLTVFIERARTSGKMVLVVTPIQTCDYSDSTSIGGTSTQSAAYGLWLAEENATTNAYANAPIGGLPQTTEVINGVLTNTFTEGHLGADCRTPDAWLQNQYVQAIARDIAARLAPASSAPASAPIAASS
jgi:hypothetical protein